MGIRQVLFAMALAVPLVGSILMLEHSLPLPGSHGRPTVPSWFAAPFLWAVVLSGNAQRFFDNILDDRPSGFRFSISRIMLGMVVVYTTAWIAEMISFAFRYVETDGGLADLIWWTRRGRYSGIPGGVGPIYLYTLAFSVFAAIRGYDRVTHHEELIR